VAFSVRRPVGFLFWIEAFFASLSAFLAVLTVAWRDWIEGIFGFDPDHHNGSVEWIIVVACCLVAVACSLLARREWLRASVASADLPVR
jgi:hypothetical protein